MTMFSPDELGSALERFVANNKQVRIIADYRRASMDALRAGTGTELWRMFLLVALMAAIAEMLIARGAAKGE